MFLSINPLLPDISFIVIDGDTIVELSTLAKNLDTASTFPRHLIDIVNRQSIDEIWCITGPGPFTLMRIVTLACNAVHLAQGTKLKGSHFFDMIDARYTPIIEANPRECIIRIDGEDRLIARDEIPNGAYMGLLEAKDFTECKIFVQYNEDIAGIRDVFEKNEFLSNLSPLYFKTPHITGSSKKISPSSETVSAS